MTLPFYVAARSREEPFTMSVEWQVHSRSSQVQEAKARDNDDPWFVLHAPDAFLVSTQVLCHRFPLLIGNVESLVARHHNHD